MNQINNELLKMKENRKITQDAKEVIIQKD